MESGGCCQQPPPPSTQSATCTAGWICSRISNDKLRQMPQAGAGTPVLFYLVTQSTEARLRLRSLTICSHPRRSGYSGFVFVETTRHLCWTSSGVLEKKRAGLNSVVARRCCRMGFQNEPLSINSMIDQRAPSLRVTYQKNIEPSLRHCHLPSKRRTRSSCTRGFDLVWRWKSNPLWTSCGDAMISRTTIPGLPRWSYTGIPRLISL